MKFAAVSSLENLDLAAESQKILEKSATAIVPITFVLGALLTTIYRYASESVWDTPLHGFMVLVTFQLLPLAVLKLKLLSCADRVNLVPIALVKTLLMHFGLQVMRMWYYMYTGDWTK